MYTLRMCTYPRECMKNENHINTCARFTIFILQNCGLHLLNCFFVLRVCYQTFFFSCMNDMCTCVCVCVQGVV